MPRKARKLIPESSEEEEEEEEIVSRFNNRRLLSPPRKAAYSDNGSDYEEHGHNRRVSSRSRPPHRSKGLDKSSQPNGYYVDSVDESESVDGEENVPRVPSKPPESVRIGSHICNTAPISPNHPPPAPYHTASYMNVAPMPVFHGKSSECPVKHLSRFRKVCRANNVLSDETMMTRIFPVTLEEEAALWYDLNIEPYPLLTWEEIKLAFVQAYQNVELVDQLRSELTTLTQGADEPVRTYVLRMQWILKMWPGDNHEFSDELLKDIFVDGLRQDLREWTGLQYPDSLDEALRLAFHYEHVMKGVAKGKVELKCGFCGGPHEEMMGCEARQMMRELWLKISKEESGSISIRDGTMNTSQFRCGKHQCWKKKLDGNKSNITVADTETVEDGLNHTPNFSRITRGAVETTKA